MKELFPNEPKAVQDGIGDVCDIAKVYLSRISSSVSAHLERLSPNAQPVDLPEPDFEPDIDWIGGERLMADMVSMAKETNSRAMEKYIGKNVVGSGKGADAMKNVFRRKLEGIHDPDRKISERLRTNANAMMNWSFCAEMKKNGVGTQFEKDISRGCNATLTDGKTTIKLTQNFETARNELAQFVTGKSDATYDKLGPEDKNKVHMLMSLISQETEKAGENGAEYALDPRESDSGFTITGYSKQDIQNGKGANADRTYVIEKRSDGGIDLHYTMDKPIKDVDDGTTDGDGYKVGEGSKFMCEMNYGLNGAEFNRLAKLDYGKFDDSEGYKIYNRKVDMPDGSRQFRENKLEKVVDSFAQEFKIHANCTMSFSLELLPSDEDLIDAQR